MRLLAILASFAISASGENLLSNPGFETVRGDRPARWDLFVMPSQTENPAEGLVVEDAYEGERAVVLRTPDPYTEEPVNNWSQNIIAGVEGKRLRLSGYIKSEEVGEAALWVQCWQRQPLRVLRSATTADEDPVTGTVGWRRVEVETEAPSATDFVTVRCVIEGTGEAWFDDIALEPVEGEKRPVRAAPKEQTEADNERTTDAEKKPAQTLKESSKPETAVAEPEVESEMQERLRELQGEIRKLRDAQVVTADAIDELRYQNEALMEEVVQLQRQLNDTVLTEEVQPPEGDDQSPSAEAASSSPLVPHEVEAAR